MRLKDKVAIITGAGSGIGRATAELFAAHGAQVIACDLKGAEDTAKMIGSSSLAVTADAGRPHDVAGLVRTAVDRFGGLDIFFANAGISGGFKSIFEQDADDWAEILRINLIGPALAVKYAAPVLQERGGGSIICTASVAGLRSGAGSAAYSASKAGVISLVRAAAQQLTGSNIRVNAICPGLIKTKFSQALWQDDKTLAHFTERLPIARMGTTNEISPLALFLASDASSYSTGSLFYADGGTVI